MVSDVPHTPRRGGMSAPPSQLDAALAVLNDGADVTKSLDLARAPVSEAQALTLAAAIEGKSGTLTSIDLRDCSLSGPAVAALSKSARKCAALHTLRLCGNAVTLDGASGVAALVAASDTLAKLELRYCRMGSDACEALCGAVGSSLSLEELNLSGNPIPDDAARALARSLDQTISLTKLSLADTSLQITGFGLICEATKRSPLRELHLPFNDISAQMTVSLAAALSVSSRLTTLNLHSCGLSDEDALALANGIRSGPQRRDVMKLVGIDLSAIADCLQLPEKEGVEWNDHQQILDFFRHVCVCVCVCQQRRRLLRSLQPRQRQAQNLAR